MSKDVKASLIDKIEIMRQNLHFGLDFDDMLEMLPAETADRQESAGSAPSNKTRALIGSFLCNEIDNPLLRFDGSFDGGTVVNYYGTWLDPSILETFDRWRDVARVMADRDEGDCYRDFENYRFLVMPFGMNKGVNFKYILKVGGFSFLIFSKPVSGELPTVQIQFSYEALRGRDLFQARIEAEDILLTLGFRWERVSFQRVDINVTLNLPFKQFEKAFFDGRIVSKVRRFNVDIANTADGMTLTYIDGGKDVEICLYNKYHELVTQYNEQKYDDLSHVLGNGSDLTRVEFRLKSGFFRSIDCFTYEELERVLPDVVQYLCAEWFRILKHKKIRGKENRQDLDDCWKCVQYAFYKCFVLRDDLRPVVREHRRRVNNKRLLKQAVGCITTAFARTYEKTKSFDNFVIEAFDFFQNYKRVIYREYKRKRALYGQSIPIAVNG